MTDEITPNPSEDKPLPPRGERDPAPEDQLIAYIVVDRSYVRHRTYEVARQERDYLKAKTGKQMRILKVLQASQDEIAGGTVRAFRIGPQSEVPTKSSE